MKYNFPPDVATTYTHLLHLAWRELVYCGVGFAFSQLRESTKKTKLARNILIHHTPRKLKGYWMFMYVHFAQQTTNVSCFFYTTYVYIQSLNYIFIFRKEFLHLYYFSVNALSMNVLIQIEERVCIIQVQLKFWPHCCSMFGTVLKNCYG